MDLCDYKYKVVSQDGGVAEGSIGAQQFCVPPLRNRDQVLRQVDCVYLETKYLSRVENEIPVAGRPLNLHQGGALSYEHILSHCVHGWIHIN